MVKLYRKFENLTEEKKKRIIDVCVEEFSQNGYENSSTNNIVKNAGISKGILFHYFGNKKNLYLYVLDYSLEYMMEKILKMFDHNSSDIFEKIMNTGIVKLKIAYEFPQIYKFLFDAFTHIPEELKEDIQARYNKMYQISLPVFLKDIDTSKFRKDIDVNRAIELIVLALEGVSKKYLNMFKDKSADDVLTEMENIKKEYNEYLDMLKNGIYSNKDTNTEIL